MSAQEDKLVSQSEIAVTENEIASTLSNVEVAEISDEQLGDYAIGVESVVNEQAENIIPEAEKTIESSVKSMHILPEVLTDVRYEQDLDTQLHEIQYEAVQLANQTDLNIEKVITTDGHVEINPEMSVANNLENGSLQEKVELRQKQTQEIIELVKFLRRDNPTDFIEKFNSTMNPEQIRGLEFSLIKSKGEKLLIINESGQLVEMTCTDENAVEMLRLVKKNDETVRGNSHDLRSEILKRSKGKIKTHEAYTYGQIESLRRSDVKVFLDDDSNWTEERQLLHNEIVVSELQKAAALSERLKDKRPTIYAFRGNTAAGKTTRVKNDATFQRALDIKGEPSGAINPDTYKERLKLSERVFGQEQITHFQSHNEGSMLARRINSELVRSDSSLIIDQRLHDADDITNLVNESKITGKKIRLLDVDSPMEISLVRVLARRPGGADPLVPFVTVAEGYEGVRKNRQALFTEVSNNPAIENYVLYVSDKKGQSVKVSEKSDG